MTPTSSVGTVVEFDERRGLGVVSAPDGARLPFHAVSITDGTRRVAAGSRVRFTVRAGNLGEWEAAEIKPLG